MQNFSYVIKDEVGIHARPAGLLVKEAKKYQSKIKIVKGEKSADATKLMMVMSLGVKCGEEVAVEVEGEDEETACKEMKAFFESNLQQMRIGGAAALPLGNQRQAAASFRDNGIVKGCEFCCPSGLGRKRERSRK